MAKKAAAKKAKSTKSTPKASKSSEPAKMTPEMIQQLAKVRRAVHQNYAQVVMAMSALARYRGQMLSDLQHLVVDPLMQDRVAFAHKAQPEEAPGNPEMAGFAIWASVSEDVDARIREQIRGGVFPLRLKPEDWTSGEINWLFDVVCPDPKMISSVVANFSKVANNGQQLRLHPLVARMMDPEMLEKMGAQKAPIVEDPAA